MGDWGHGGSRPVHEHCKVVIVALARFYREALAHALQNGNMAAVAASVRDATGIVRELHPDAVLMDLPVDEAPHLIRSIVKARSQVKVIAMAVAETEQDIVGWAMAGASACITRDTPLGELPTLIAEVSRGTLVGSPRVAGVLFSSLQAHAGPRRENAEPLSNREREVLRLASQGLSNQEIAHALCIQLSTVKNHLHSVFGKLGVRRRSEAVQWLRVGQALRY